MRKTLLLLMIIMLTRSGFGADEITVAAAADLNYALNQLATRFEATSGTKVKVSYGASGNLFSQIQRGAPFDLFFSADEDYPTRLATAGIAEPASQRIYALGHLVLWVPNNSPFDPGKLQMEVLTQPAVTRIAIANPQHAPYGRAAEAAMRSLGVYDPIKSKLVLGENIAQALQFVESGNAEIGIVALSLVMAPSVHDQGRFYGRGKCVCAAGRVLLRELRLDPENRQRS